MGDKIKIRGAEKKEEKNQELKRGREMVTRGGREEMGMEGNKDNDKRWNGIKEIGKMGRKREFGGRKVSSNVYVMKRRNSKRIRNNSLIH